MENVINIHLNASHKILMNRFGSFKTLYSFMIKHKCNYMLKLVTTAGSIDIVSNKQWWWYYLILLAQLLRLSWIWWRDTELVTKIHLNRFSKFKFWISMFMFDMLECCCEYKQCFDKVFSKRICIWHHSIDIEIKFSIFSRITEHMSDILMTATTMNRRDQKKNDMNAWNVELQSLSDFQFTHEWW